MNKLRIILDNNAFGTEMLHTALRFAQVAKEANYMDVKIVMPQALHAELKHKGILNYRYMKAQQLHHGRALAANQPKPLQMRHLLEDYADFVEVPPAGDVENRLKQVLAEQLGVIYAHNRDRFYDIIKSSDITIDISSRDILAALNNPAVFSNAYTGCMRNPQFKCRLDKDGLGGDLGDQSVISWYKTAVREADTILVSFDQGFVTGMKNVYENVEPHTHCERFDHFDQQAFAHHLFTELQHMKENGYGDANAINSCQAACKAISETKKYPGPSDYNHLFERSQPPRSRRY